MHGQDNIVKSKIILKEEREGKRVFPFVLVNLQTATLHMCYLLKRSNHMTRSRSLSSISASSFHIFAMHDTSRPLTRFPIDPHFKEARSLVHCFLPPLFPDCITNTKCENFSCQVAYILGGEPGNLRIKDTFARSRGVLISEVPLHT